MNRGEDMLRKLDVKNFMEDAVFNELKSSLANHKDACYCQKCLADVCSIALNKLPTKYYSTISGETYSRVETLGNQFKIDIIIALNEAIENVKNSPRHDHYVSKAEAGK